MAKALKQHHKTDLVIGGAAFVGLALAIALRQGLGETFAHMIENRHLIDALVAKAKELGIDLRAGAVSGFEYSPNAVDVQLADGETISARLLVGADGARSKIRETDGL